MGTPKRSVLAGLAAVAAVGLLSACGHPPAAPGPGGTAVPGSGAAPARPSPLAAEVLDNFVPATGAQYATGARFDGTLVALQDTSVERCMARYGFHMTAGFGLSAPAFAAMDVDNSQFPDLARIARTASFDVGSGFPPQPGPSPARRQAYAADSAGCWDMANRPFARLLQVGGALANRWLGVVNAVQTSPQVRAKLTGFASCLEAEGVPASAAGTLGAFLAWETGVDTHARNLARIHATDAHWAPIFARCARPTVTLQERLQSARRAVFLRQNYAQIRRLEALASQDIPAARHKARAA
jgi:hypothetical protein